MSSFKRLCISGGGMLGYQFLGALQYISDSSSLSGFDTYVGTSVGAVICYLLAIGYTPMEILIKLSTSNVWTQFKHPNLVSMLQGDGAYSYSPVQDFMERATIEKIGKFITLSALRDDYGKHLTCTTYNMTKKTTEKLSPDTQPDLPCLTALRMTSGVPFAFEAYRYGSSRYIDGGVVNNFPLDYLVGNDLTVAITSPSRAVPSTGEEGEEEFDLFSFALRVVTAASAHHTNHMIEVAKERSGLELIVIEGAEEVFAFSLSTPAKLDLFSKGYRNAKAQFLEEN